MAGGGEAATGSLREDLVADALRWAQRFGVAPAITGAISEYDAAVHIVGMTEEEYAIDCRTHTAVTKGVDFTHKRIRYQVKANRASGKPGSSSTARCSRSRAASASNRRSRARPSA